MIWLILGVLLWSGVHFFPALLPAQRTQLINRWGNALYQGVFALLIVLSIALIIVGWRSTLASPIYDPPHWGRHLTMLLMLIAIILLGAGNVKTRIKQGLRHPMLTGVAVWAVAHLLANGDIRSLILFGGLLIWSVISQTLINRRDGAWVKPETTPPLATEVKLIGIGLVVYLVLVFLHPYFAGVGIMPRS